MVKTFELTKDSNFKHLPLYEKISMDLRQKVCAGEFKKTGRLPQERSLARSYGVSRDTIRQAVGTLCDEKLIKKIRGKGLIVNPKLLERSEIALLMYDMPCMTSFVNGLMGHIENVLNLQSFFLFFMSLRPERPDVLDEAILRLQSRANLGGVVLMGNFGRGVLEKFKVLELPVVLAGDIREPERAEEPYISQVVGNDYQLGYLATSYLIDYGHRKIGMLTGSRHWMWNRGNYEGYRDALRAHSIECLDEYQAEYGDSRGFNDVVTEEAARLIRKLVSCKDKPTALIVPEECYLAVMQVLCWEHIRIPEEISLVCIGNDANWNEQMLARKSLTRAILPLRSMAEDIVDLLQKGPFSDAQPKQRRVTNAKILVGNTVSFPA